MLLSVWVLGCAGSQAVPAAAPAPVAAPAPPAPPSPAAPVPGQYYNPSELSAEAGEAILLTVDSDGDGFANGLDNCPGVANPDQIDTDGNGFGDACEGPLSYVDIATMLSFSANPARVNRSMTLRMSISNKGDTASGPATLDLNVADEVRFLAVASSGPWKCKFKPASGWLNCTAGNLEPGATKTVVLRMKPLQAGTFKFWARAESVHHEHDFENNVVTSELVVGL